ncbi:MAG: aldehyde dehydrogenase family protein [Azoarcus sp.]|nr:aldehyde dehydrogenase family protein [Azoarcus sp.]
MHERNEYYIDGAWRALSSRERIEVRNPASGECVGSVPAGHRVDVDAAVRAARAAFPHWNDTPPAQRADALHRVATGLRDRAEEIALTITAEMGMPIRMTRRIQAPLPAEVFATTADALDGIAFEERIRHSRVTRTGRGVVGCITPWNYPLHQIAAKVAPALAAGCTVVLKPSELAPLNAFILAEIMHEAGVPPGVFNLVSGHGRSAGASLVAHPDVDAISFTGSTEAGRRVAESAARTVKHVALELGGKSASIVLDGADFDSAVRTTVSRCMLNSGQTCNALTRLLVPVSRHDEAARLAVAACATLQMGDPLLETSKLGPLVSEAQAARVRRFIDGAIADGAELLCGGSEAPPGLGGNYVPPTVLGHVAPHSALAQQEVFGPVLAILSYPDGDEDAAAAIAEATPYGLAAAVWAGDDEAAMRFGRRLRVGQVDINGGVFNPAAPMGGMKYSGTGRELGRAGIEEFLETRSFQLPQRDTTT